MKTAVLEDWKSIHVREVSRPTPLPVETLIRVVLAGVCGSDVHFRNDNNYGIVKELSLVGGRVCPRNEFCEAFDILRDLHPKWMMDFGKITTAPRSLEQLERPITAVISNQECAQILIKQV